MKNSRNEERRKHERLRARLSEAEEMPENSLPVKNLTSLLSKKLGNDLKIVKVDWKNLTDPGDNYGSLIIAVNATVERNSRTEVVNLVVKLPPPSAWLQELFNTPFTFLKELQFYRDLTPAFMALQRENKITEAESTWLGADYYGGRMGLGEGDVFDDEAAIVLENLNYSGYKTVDRLLGLNSSQADLAVRKLGKLHGIVIAMRTRKPEIFEKLILPALVQPANETAKNCVGDMIAKALADLNLIPGCEAYLTSVEKTMKYLESLEESPEMEKPKDKWATLVHNDFWTNNMMFKHDEATKSVVDMKIVDFQLCVYDYGVKDLIFFLISSPTQQVIEEEFDRLIDRYYEAFADTLRSMTVDPTNYPKKEFHQRFNECATLKFPQCLMMNQVIKSKPDVVPKMEDIKSKENFLTIGGGEIYNQKMLHTLQFYHKRGWLIK
ncbi:uncharacterized protein [Venturia canescens]|uniref:uncharacterized protein isoform X2 n=1 Tax=Venturia canescens TaxID=32260 RepID=UPI001C9CCA4B|nr:uncharacterized protein LOC122413682 isoform X2 [Venturia canescens]